MAEAKYPGTCGELLQGWIQGSEKLISCPIDLYSTVRIKSGVQTFPVMPRIEEALLSTLAFFNLPSEYRDGLCVEHTSDLPIGKGYASSTADICATIKALSRYLNNPIKDEEIATLATAIEPSDSVMFTGLALFDHNRGILSEQFHLTELPSVLILEPSTTLLTKDFHQIDRSFPLVNAAPLLQESFTTFSHGALRNKPFMIGRAATISARANQAILNKPMLESIINISEQFGLYGCCIAHSGSIVGLLYNKQLHNIHSVLSKLDQEQVLTTYPIQRLANMVEGGVS
ncbi:GHMP family kinase ATP-binding protein [Vibrio viridaestus]|uniref:GHMP kinase n=1 Tax=Vibrio viridaestus TaxID=2487322 RepID=A0A3N9TL20_9VIBR|nr:GHMP kinase [Vibrio viridaestus]RQW64563.1 GHMP kinase [Vibrio viridaestus]